MGPVGAPPAAAFCLYPRLTTQSGGIPPFDHFPLLNFYANPIESSGFWSDRYNIASFVQIETDFSCEFGCGDGALAICLFARVIQQLGIWTQKSQPTSTTPVWRCEETCRIHLALPRTQASEPALTESNLAAKRRAEALHVALFSTKHPSPVRCCFLHARYSRMTRNQERRALGVLLFLIA